MNTTFSISLASGARRERQACAELDAALFDEKQVNDYEAYCADEFRAAGGDFDAARYLFRRYIAIDDDVDEIVGYGQFYQTPWEFDPHRYHLTIRVHPDYQGFGVGTQLYEQMMMGLEALDARSVRAEVYETMENGCAWLEHRGWHELFRSWQFVLNPQRFDPAPLDQYFDQIAAEGITIANLTEASQYGTSWLPRLYELHTLLRASMLAEYTPLPLERFALMVAGKPESLPDAFFIACDGEHYIGESYLQRGEEPDTLEHKYTGVLPAYRGCGIATALTLKTIAYAAEGGYERITTWADSTNPAMVAINEKLGFERELATVWYEKSVGNRQS